LILEGPLAQPVSASLGLGWITVALGCAAVIGNLFSRGPGMDLEGARFHEVVFTFIVPRFLAPCMALGTVGAAFAEGGRRPNSMLGVALGGVGAALPWLAWGVRCGCFVE
jgi:hypothetical protein